MIKNVLSKLYQFIFPSRCVFCGKYLNSPAAEWICASCRGNIVEQSAGTASLRGGFPCVYALRYEGAVRRAILRFKFNNRPQIAQTFAYLMAQAASAYAGSELITWVPVSRLRGMKRGYDQSFLLCRYMCECFQRKPTPTLVKHRHNKRQSRLDAEQRASNVTGAYHIRPHADVLGKRVLLVDDILTTGATLGECAQTLRRAGASEVVCVVLARTVHADHGHKSTREPDLTGKQF